MARRVLVLGGSGFVGSYIRDELARDHDVETTSSTGASATHAFDVLRLDREAALLLGDGFDVIVNCIVRRRGSLEDLFAVNVRGTVDVMAVAADLPIHVVQVSSILATEANRHLSDYSLTKFVADEVLVRRSAGAACRLAVLRFGQVFDSAGRSRDSQPGLHRWATQLRAGEPVDVFAGGTARRSYIDAGSAARAVRHAIEHGLTGVHDVVPAVAYAPADLVRWVARLGGHAHAEIRLINDTVPVEYAIPPCSPAFQSWMAREPDPSHAFAALVRHG